MLICVGGIPGSGRKDFARRLAEQTGFFALDLESSMRTLSFMSEFRRARMSAADTDVLSDEFRLRMFMHVARDFEYLARTFKDVIVQEPFHRAVPRTFLFEQGNAQFSKTAAVWVEETEADMEERAQRITALNPRLSRATAAQIIERMEREFEPFASPPIVTRNVISNDRAVHDVVRALGL